MLTNTLLLTFNSGNSTELNLLVGTENVRARFPLDELCLMNLYLYISYEVYSIKSEVELEMNRSEYFYNPAN